jgi:hypothetical protein
MASDFDSDSWEDGSDYDPSKDQKDWRDNSRDEDGNEE